MYEMVNNQPLSKIQSMESEIVQFTKDLMKIKAISPGAEYFEIVNFLRKAYTSAGLEVKTLTGSEEKIEQTGFEYPRYNILGRLEGKGGGPTLAIFSHMDTVGLADLQAWKSDPFQPVLRDNKIFGLGAMDARCSIACAYFATKSIIQSGIHLNTNLTTMG